jgi:very-short-patch-repair endonuclease
MTTTLPKLEMHGVFLGTEAVGAGAVSAQQLRGKRYTRLFRDAYIPAGYRITHALRCEAAALVVPDAAVLTGRSAAAILGLDLTRPGDPVEWLIEESLQFGARGMAMKRTPIASTDWFHGKFCRLATPSRMGFDLARGSNLRKAVSFLDAMVHHGLVNLPELQRYCSARHEHGVRNARAAVELVDGRAESLPESELRVVLAFGGIEVTPQVGITDANGMLIARADLAVDGYKVAIEYDGAWHSLREQLEKDWVRLRRLRDDGWEVVHITAKDLAGDPAALCDAVRRACARASRRG